MLETIREILAYYLFSTHSLCAISLLSILSIMKIEHKSYPSTYRDTIIAVGSIFPRRQSMPQRRPSASHTSKKNLMRKQEDSLMELELAQFILTPCKTAEQDRLDANQPLVRCTCRRCTERPPPAPRECCNCSGPNCMPLLAPPKQSTTRNTIPKKDRLAPIERALADRALIDF